MRFVVVGAGAIGGTVGARLARDGHDVLFCDADAEHVAAINEHGLDASRGRSSSSRCRAPRGRARTICRTGSGAVLLAVKSQHTGAALAAIAPRLAPDGFVVSLQNGLNEPLIAAGRRRGADGRRVRQLRRGLPRPRDGSSSAAAAPSTSASSTAGRSERVARLVARPRRTRSATGQHPRLPLGEGGLRRDALRDRRLRPLDRRRARRAALPTALRPRSRRRCSPSATAAPEPFDGFDPDDLDGSIDRLVEFNRRSAKTHSGIYRDLAVRKRKTETAMLDATRRAARAAHARADPRDRGRPPRLRGREPRAARRVRAPRGVGAAAERGDHGRSAARPSAPSGAAARRAGRGQGQHRRARRRDDERLDRRRRRRRPTRDATVVARLRAAGAELLCKTNLLEYAAGSVNPAYGMTFNPLDASRTSGGSSSGSAALVAAGVCDRRARHRHRRLDPDPGRVLRHRRAQADVRARAGRRACSRSRRRATTSARSRARSSRRRRCSECSRAVGTSCDRSTGCASACCAGSSTTPTSRRPCATRVLGRARDASAGGLRARRRRPARARPRRRRARRDRPQGGLRRPPRSCSNARRDGYGPGTRALLELGAAIDDDAYRAGLADRERVAAGFATRLRGGRRARRADRRRIRAPPEDPPFGTPEGDVEGRFTSPYNLAGVPAVSLPVRARRGRPARRPAARRRRRQRRALLLSVARDYEEVDAMRVHDCNWMQLEAYLADGRSDRAAARLDRAARLPLARRRHDPLRARLGRGGGAARRAGAAVAPVRADAVLRRLPRQPDAAASRRTRRSCRDLLDSLLRPGLPALPARQRPRRQRPGPAPPRAEWTAAHPDAQVALAQLVERPAHLGGRRVDRPRREPRVLARELPLDAPRGRRAAGRAQADGRHLARCASPIPADVRELLGDGSLGGLYERPDDDVLRVWQAGVEEVRDAARATAGEVPDLAGRSRSSPARRTGSAPRSRARSRSTGRTVHGVRPGHRRRDATREQVDALRRADRRRRHPRQQRGRRRRPGRPAARGGLRRRLAGAIVDANLTSTFVCTRAVVPGMKARRLRPDRQHLLRRRTQREPHRHPGVREREGRADRLHAPDRARARAASGSRSTASRPASCSRTRPAIAPVGELRRGGPARAARADRDAAARARPRTSPTACSSSSPRRPSWVTGQVISIDGGHSIF